MFDVFVEGAVETTPDAVRRLADTMAVKFGLSADDFVARLVRGRVRVKAKVDRSTADAYVRELVKIGARCTVEESRPTAATPPSGVRLTTPPGGLRAATPPTGVRTPPSRAELLRTSTPPSGVAQTSRTTPPVGSAVQRPPTSPRAASVSSGPFEARARTISAGMPTRPPAPLVAATFRTPASGVPTKPPPTSGLSAATVDPGTPTNLGALDTSSPLALSSLDGNDAMTDSSGSFGPPLELDNGPSGEPGKLIAPKPAAGANKPAAPSKDRPKDEPLDLFAPPDAGEEQLAVEIAPDELEYKARKQLNTPPAMPVVTPARDATPIPERRSSPALAAQPEPGRARSKLGPLADLKIRFAAGVVAAILVGFLPATVIASIREHAAFKAIDESYVEASMDPANQNPDLDGTFLDKKKSARREIAITSMLIWALGGGAIAYVWFRRVPWARWA